MGSLGGIGIERGRRWDLGRFRLGKEDCVEFLGGHGGTPWAGERAKLTCCLDGLCEVTLGRIRIQALRPGDRSEAYGQFFDMALDYSIGGPEFAGLTDILR